MRGGSCGGRGPSGGQRDLVMEGGFGGERGSGDGKSYGGGRGLVVRGDLTTRLPNSHEIGKITNMVIGYGNLVVSPPNCILH